MESYIKAVIESASRLGEMRKAQLESVRHRFGRGIYAVSHNKLKNNLQCGKEYELLLVSSKLNINSSYGESFNFKVYTFSNQAEVEKLINVFLYYNGNNGLGKRVNIYIRG